MNTRFNLKKTVFLVTTLTLLLVGAEQLAAASYICGCGAPPPSPGQPDTQSGASR